MTTTSNNNLEKEKEATNQEIDQSSNYNNHEKTQKNDTCTESQEIEERRPEKLSSKNDNPEPGELNNTTIEQL